MGTAAYTICPASCGAGRCGTLRRWSWPMCWAMTLYGRKGEIYVEIFAAESYNRRNQKYKRRIQQCPYNTIKIRFLKCAMKR